MIKSLMFNRDFRLFPKGTEFVFPERVTVIVGDNGAGKSTLVGALRAQFETGWSPSQIHFDKDDIPVTVTPKPEPGSKMTYVDLAMDHFSTRPTFDFDNIDIQLAVRGKSSGQVALAQFLSLMDRSKAKIHVIDEPERGLSPFKINVLAALLKQAIEDRPEDQFFIVTHNVHLMDALGQKVLFMPFGTYVSVEEYWMEAHRIGRIMAERALESRKELTPDAKKKSSARKPAEKSPASEDHKKPSPRKKTRKPAGDLPASGTEEPSP